MQGIPYLVVFDGDCPFCRSLAGFMSRAADSHATFMTYTDFASQHENPPTKENLIVVVENEIREGTEAWEWLLIHHPHLHSLGWLAGKLGLEQTVARGLQRTGKRLRGLCLLCRGRGR